jgi:deoxyribodipyrimidine photolyase-related protein
MKAALVLATQLFDEHPAYSDPEIDLLVVIESVAAFRRRRYHAHKIVLLLSSMRHTVAELRYAGRDVVHHRLRDPEVSFSRALSKTIEERDITHLAWMRPTDDRVHRRLLSVAAARGVHTRTYPDALFLTPDRALDGWFAAHPARRMEDFYRWQRRRTGVLMHDGAPAGGRWNFDAENRHPLPRDKRTRALTIDIPPLPAPEPDEITREAIADAVAHFADHPGDPETFWLPVTSDAARLWLADFIERRLPSFGRYEDAMDAEEPFLFHSVISPLLNIGLITTAQVVAEVEASDAPIESREGFLRQVIGWREYMRGAFRAQPDLVHANHFGLTRTLEPWWYTGEGIPEDLPLPVRAVLERVHGYGYAHHIERLMVLGNWFLLQGYEPREVYEWFSAMFVDAYDWVMVPNVQGMSQYADGGRVATKPYIAGGVYLQRMGSWWPTAKDPQADAVTAAYWEFLDRHEPELADNPRLALPLAQMRRRRAERAAPRP